MSTPSDIIGKQDQPLFPVSFRVTKEEKAWLKKDAGAMAVAHYIRKCLFGNYVSPRAQRYLTKQKTPKIDAQELALLLGMFGQSELARSMLALSMAAQAGDLDVTPEVSGKLERACDDIHDIKTILITALGVKPQNGDA